MEQVPPLTGETSGMTIVVPADRAITFGRLASVGNALIDRYGGQGTALSVVEIPADRSLSEGALVVQRRRNLLRRVGNLHPSHGFLAEVRTAHSFEGGIRAAVRESDASLLLLGWQPKGRHPDAALERLVLDPPCDLAVVKNGRSQTIGRVLLPVRGGPHARLALRVAEAVAACYGAELTLLHIDVPHSDERRRATEERFFQAVRQRVSYERTSCVRVDAESVEAALLDVGAHYQVVVMGAARRDEASPYLLGRIPERVARKLACMAILVKTREPVTSKTFSLAPSAGGDAADEDISEVVDRWFAENTFHSHEFRTIRDLVALKERQGTTISVAVPTLNEEKTVGPILASIKRNLIDRYPLIDEMIVIDSESQDRTVEIATSLGVPVHTHPQILPQYGSYRGKGEGLWKSLYVTTGDIVVWIDSDITGIHPKFVYGLIGPLLTQPRLGFVKGFYRRPLNLGDHISTTGGGRVTELTARPLINLFYPHLSGLVQPLAGEMAGRRSLLESVPFFTGYGVETGLLIDILCRFGLRSIGQTDLQVRVHRNQTLLSLSKMAFAIVQVVIKRLGESHRLELMEDVSTSMKLIHYSPTELFLEVKEIQEHERPPISTLPEYMSRRPAPAGTGLTPGRVPAG